MHFLRSLILFLCLAGIFSSSSIRALGNLGNVEGDGYAPAPTLTALVLGFSRYDSCNLDLGEWYCDGPNLDRMPWVKQADWPKSEFVQFVARYMYWPFEIVILFVIGLIAVPPPPEPKKE